MRGRKPKAAEAGDTAPEPVAITRAMVITATGFESEQDAREWLARCGKHEAERDRAVERALRAVNRTVRGQRAAARDPYLREVTHRHAHRVRLGYGTGDELVNGRWREAVTLPAPRARSRRRQALEPQHELAAVLSGRSPVRVSEDLALRARLDLEQGHHAQAALQLEAALTALAAEAESDTGKNSGPTGRELRVHELAMTALRGALDEHGQQELAGALEDLERSLRRLRFGGGAG